MSWVHHVMNTCNKTMKTNLPGMGTYPLVNDGHSSIFKELQVLCGRLKPHHVWQQPFQLLQFYKITQIYKNIYGE